MSRTHLPPARGSYLAAVLTSLALAALFVWLAGCGRAQAQALRPGVGYTPRSGVNTSCSPWEVRSIAVAAVDAGGVITTAQPHGLAANDQVLAPRALAVVSSVPSPTQLTLRGGQPTAGGVLTTWFLRSLMACRYGPRWEGGVRGPHSSDYERYMREDFANRTARWYPDYNLYDGNPTAQEVTDAYYSGDRRVLPLEQPAPSPTATAVPQPTATPVEPQPAPTVAPTPRVEPTPAATPCPTCPPPVACEVCPRFERVTVPPKHARTVEFAGTWDAGNAAKLRERFERLKSLAVWLGGQLDKLYVPSPLSNGLGITSTIEPCRDLGGGCFLCDELAAPVCVEAAP